MILRAVVLLCFAYFLNKQNNTNQRIQLADYFFTASNQVQHSNLLPFLTGSVEPTLRTSQLLKNRWCGLLRYVVFFQNTGKSLLYTLQYCYCCACAVCIASSLSLLRYYSHHHLIHVTSSYLLPAGAYTTHRQ